MRPSGALPSAGSPACRCARSPSDAGLKNQASLYHHFKNKKALYEAVLARGVEPIIEMVASSQTRRRHRPGARPHASTIWRPSASAAPDPARRTRRHQAAAQYGDASCSARSTDRPQHARHQRRRRWDPSEMPHLAVGIYHLIFGYFANAALFETVLPEDPRSPAALARQAHFLKLPSRACSAPTRRRASPVARPGRPAGRAPPRDQASRGPR